MRKRPALKATDKRRKTRSQERVRSQQTRDTNGAGPPLAHLFNDRRYGPNGQGSRLT